MVGERNIRQVNCIVQEILARHMFHSPVIDVYVTGICNLGCRYCFGELDSKAGMSQSVFLETLNFAQQAGAVAIEFCGGEPLLYKNLAWAVEKSRQSGFKLILRTNALCAAQHRSFIASNFDTVGISLDGDAWFNDVMRPMKLSTLTAEEKFQIPLQEISALKSVNPKMQILLASVATKINVDGLRNLASILVRQQVPLDLWKVHQFVSNNFRAVINSQEFSLEPTVFERLSSDLAKEVGRVFPLICRRSNEVDGSCLVVNSDGDVLLGARKLGNVSEHSPLHLCNLLERIGAEDSIANNKQMTYGKVLKKRNLGT